MARTRGAAAATAPDEPEREDTGMVLPPVPSADDLSKDPAASAACRRLAACRRFVAASALNRAVISCSAHIFDQQGSTGKLSVCMHGRCMGMLCRTRPLPPATSRRPPARPTARRHRIPPPTRPATNSPFFRRCGT